ncbi:hypothetical protein WH47_10484 [Habropoda laboriosa]|uniref:Chitin-binding type-2 domain-containing protein n=1 Tax=Habropoda laboriosa TaxID=597456 RepID=A0A0L7QMZ4_9HYME|nr:hypothetical protein WH47_10484 [Habropoda laboriosa]
MKFQGGASCHEEPSMEPEGGIAKYFDPEEEGAFDSFGSAGGQYDPYQEKTENLTNSKINKIHVNNYKKNEYFYSSPGYYADEVAGCQVFHVCHDVLVSSFLCPIGSIFSQKLLTCDWWTKVDCSSSSKYIDVNRNSYQQDDDEMIRNAYAMISLQSGTDVTKDGLVDPDRTGSIVDYQRGPGKILDYSSVDPAGNDLRINFEDYPRPFNRDFLPPYQLKDKKPETSRSYQEKFYPLEKSRSPYEDSPIIRVQKINDPEYNNQQRNRDFQEPYRRPNEFTHQFQPSYAPTVPTVTTTTRRFYSPTVPTTFRPSTLAYNKLDQLIDSSDYYFSHSRAKGFVTPPTRLFSNDDKAGQTLGGASKKSEAVSPRKLTRDDDYGRQASYEDDYEDVNSEEMRSGRSRERFQVRVADHFNLNRTGVSNLRSSFFDDVYRGFDQARDEEEAVDDFELRGSIGLGHALSQSFRGIPVDQQNPVKSGSKDENKGDYQHTLAKPESNINSEERKEQTTEQYQRNDQRDDQTDNSSNLSPSTTPSVIESTIKASTSLYKPLNSSLSSGSGDLANLTGVNSELWEGKDSIDRIDSAFHAFRPKEFLKPREKSQSKFQIKVPDLSEVSTLLIRYSTLEDAPYAGTRTTELPRFQSTYSDDYIDQPTSYNENLGVTSNYGDTEDSRGSSFQNYPTTMARPLISPTGSWFPSSSSDQLDVKIPPSDYSDTDNENRSSNRHQVAFKNNAKEKVANRLQITVEDPVQSPNANIPKTIATTVSPNPPISSTSTLSVNSSLKSTSKGLNEASEATESSESTSSHVTYRRKPEEESQDGKDNVEASTANSLLRSIRPETLKQIEENIEKNNSPYQVTLIVNKDEKLIPTGGDLISKLIAEQGKETSTLSDKVHELEVIKSVEPELETTTVNILDDIDQSSSGINLSSYETSDLKRRNLNTVSLLQLMSELLKLDRVPRPFSVSDTQGSEVRTQSQILHDILSTKSSKSIAKDINSNAEQEEEGVTESNDRTLIPRSKQEILGQLAENFGEALYKKDRQPIFDLPEKQRPIDIQIGPFLRSTNKHEVLNSVKSTVSTIVSTNPKASTTVEASTPKIMLTTEAEKTIVKTEFLPSIGFSLDTDEGREEYVEAVLGGLIEPQTAESEKQEVIVVKEVEKEELSKKNETSKKI